MAAAISPRMCNYAALKLRELEGRAIYHMHDPQMDIDGFLKMAFPPDVRGIAKNVEGWFSVGAIYSWWRTSVSVDGKEHYIVVSVDSRPRTAVPPDGTAPYDPEPIRAFVRGTRDIAARFKVGKFVLDYAQNNFTAYQMAFFIPTILVLLEGFDGKKAEMATLEKMRQGKVPPSLPPITPEMREAIRTTNATITSASMMSDAITERAVAFRYV